MSDAALRVYDAATKGGMTITPQVLVVAIRAAALECCDKEGCISLSQLFELTCSIENITS